MATKRAESEKVEAFSAPKWLLEMARKRALEMRVSKSGYYRYALAKELGHSEGDAMDLAMHRGLKNALEAMDGKSRYPDHQTDRVELNDLGKKGDGRK